MASRSRERSGARNYQVTLEQSSQTVSSGDASQTWTTVDTVWAQMEAIGGRMIGVTMEADWRFTMQYRSDITSRWRLGLVGTTRKFNILSVQDPDGRQFDLVAMTKEVLA